MKIDTLFWFESDISTKETVLKLSKVIPEKFRWSVDTCAGNVYYLVCRCNVVEMDEVIGYIEQCGFKHISDYEED